MLKHQFKYSYTGTHLEEFSPVDITMEFPGDTTIQQMLYNFECYMKACGFHFDGHLEIVNETLDDDDEIYGCMADFDKECGCETTSSPLETSKDSKWTKAEKMLKEWNEGIAKLDNEQLQKAMKTAHEMSGLHYEATKEVVKNNWVHGMCNPPSPDWKKKK